MKVEVYEALAARSAMTRRGFSAALRPLAVLLQWAAFEVYKQPESR